MTYPPSLRLRHALLAIGLTGSSYLGILAFLYFLGRPTIRRHHLESQSIAVLIVWVLLASSTGRQNHCNEPTGRNWAAAIYTTLGAIAFLLLCGSMGYGFFSDDFVLLQMAREGRYFGTAEFVRPLPLLVWRILQTLRAGPFVFHATSVVLHGLNAYLVWRLARLLGYRGLANAAAPALFLAFPGSIEAVVWPAGIQDLMMTAAILGMCVVVFSRPSFRQALLAALLGIIAVGSKETGVVLPLLAVLVLWMGNSLSTRRVPVVGAALLSVATAVFLRVWYRPPDSHFLIGSRYELKELLIRPFAYLAIPVHVEWAREHALVLSAFVAVLWLALMGAAWTGRVRAGWRRYAGVVLWVYISVLPLQRYLFVSDHLEGSRYLYLPAVAWALLLAEVLADASVSSRVTTRRITPALIVLVGFVALIPRNMSSWSAAAVMRDRVLAEAEAAYLTSGCTVVRFSGFPDTSDGAQVFRNGFYEAAGLPQVSPGASNIHGRCSFTWKNGRFGTPAGP